MENPNEVNLLTINNGAAVELFQEEFRKVLANINDVCIESDAAREITMKFRIKPSPERTSAVVGISVSSKLGPIIEHRGSMFLSAKKAFVINPDQNVFNFSKEEGRNE